MHTTRFTRLPGMMLAVMLMLVGAQGLGGGPEAQAGDRGKLEGTWLIETTRVHCDTREPLLAPFPSVHTYLRGGTALDIGAAPPLDPVVTRQIGSRHLGAYGRSDLSRALPRLQF